MVTAVRQINLESKETKFTDLVTPFFLFNAIIQPVLNSILHDKRISSCLTIAIIIDLAEMITLT